MNGKHSQAGFPLAAVLVIVLALPVPAAGPPPFSFCPPAYCRKQWPRVGPAVPGCLADSYCCKPLPFSRPVAPSACANYLSKPMPECPARAHPCR